MAKLLTGTRIYGTGTVDTQLFVSGTDPATSVTSGALQVIGGVGIGGALWVGTTSFVAGSQIITTATINDYASRTYVYAGTDTAVNTSTGNITIWNTSTLQSVTNRGATTNNAISFTNSTSATSTASGALQVVGGVGVGGSLYVGNGISGSLIGGATGSLVYQSNTSTTAFLSVGSSGQVLTVSGGLPAWAPLSGVTAGNATTASNLALGTAGQVPYQTAPGVTSFYGPGTAGDVLVSNGTSAPSYNNTLTLAGTTAATSTTTGALRVFGGAGIGGNLYVGGDINIPIASGNLIFGSSSISAGSPSIVLGRGSSGDTNTISANQGTLYGSFSTGLKIFANGAKTIDLVTYDGGWGVTGQGIGLRVNPNRDVQLFGLSNSTSTTSGALTVVGGVGIGGGIYVGNNSTFTGIVLHNNSTSATSTNTGALQVWGGVGIGQNLYVGGTIYGNLIGYASTSTSTNNLIGGATGSLPYQSNISTTAFLAVGSSGQILTVTGGLPAWTSLGALSAGNATTASNLALGTAGQVPYQTAPGVTNFYGPGTAGNVLVSNGTGAPSYNNTLTLAGTTTATSTITGALQVVGGIGVGGNLYVGSGTVPTLYTDLAGNVGIGTITPTANLHVNGDVNTGVKLRVQNVNTGTGAYVQLNTQVGSNSLYNYAFGDNYTTAGRYIQSSGVIDVTGAGGLGLSAGSSSSTANISFWTNGNNERVRISAAGTATIFSSANATSTATGALQVVGGVGIGGDLFLGGNKYQVGGTYATLATTFNLINTTATTVNFAGAATTLTMGASGSGTTNVRNNLTVSGNLTVQGTTTIVDSTVTNIADPILTLGGPSNNGAPVTDDNKDRGIAFKWVNNGGSTSTGFFGYDDSTGYFTYVQTATITNEVVSGTKGAMDVNLAGGSAMAIHYQSAVDTTAFLAAGTAGYILQTNGTGSAPSWVAASGVSAGSATYADNVRTIGQSTNAVYYPTFVDSNNATNAYELVYTTSSFVINPSNGYVGHGTASPSTNLTVGGTAASGGASGGLGAFLSRGVTTNFYEAFDGTKSYIAGVDNTLSYAKAGTLSSHDLAIVTGNGAKIYIQNSSGNVGINTSAPAGLLTINNNSADGTSDYTKGIVFTDNTNGTGPWTHAGIWTVGSSNYNGNLIFGTDGDGSNNTTGITEKMRITNAGGISFGTTGTAYGTSGQVLQSNGNAPPTWVTIATSNASSTGTTSTFVIQNSTSATSTASGALQVWGGAGVGGSLYVGGTIYSGGSPIVPLSATTQEIIATAGQTSFTVSAGYVVGYVQVFANGILLNTSDYAATNGTTVVVVEPRKAGDVMRFVAPVTYTVNSGSNALTAGQVAVIAQTASATYYPTFVDSNNATSQNEFLCTTSSFSINPSTGLVTIAAGAGGDGLPSFRITQGTAPGTFNWASSILNSSLSGGKNLINLVGQAESGNNSAYFGFKYIGASNTLNFATIGLYGADNLLNVLASGNVGVGTTSPSQLVEAYKTANADVVIQVSNDNAGTSATAQFFASNGSTKTQFFHTGGSYSGTGVLASAPGLGGIYNTTAQGLALISAHASGVIKFATGSSNTERVRIDSTGSVGINVTGPSARLHVGGSADGESVFKISGSGSTNATVKFADVDIGGQGYGGSYLAWGRGGSYDNWFMVFTRTGGNTSVERLRITANGGVSFGAGGTNYGTSGYILKSNGDAAPTWVDPTTVASANATNAGNLTTVIATANATYYPSFVDSNNGTAAYEAHYTTSSFAINPATGNIGLNVAPSAFRIDTLMTTTASGRVDFIQLGHTGQNTLGIQSFGQSHASSPAANQIAVYNAEQHLHLVTDSQANVNAGTSTLGIFLRSGGNVGIGTKSPSARLHVYEAGAADATLKITPANGSYDALLQMSGQDGAIATEGFEIWYNNSVGDVHLSTTYPNDAAAIRFHTRTGASKSTSNERLTILGTGKVGVGTTAPAGRLHVVGAGNASGGNITIGDTTDLTAKWSYLVSTHYAATSQPQGFALIGGYTASGENRVTIGGCIYETNPSTQIEFWTYTSSTHNLGGTMRMAITRNGGVAFGSSAANYGTSGQILQSNGDAAPTWVSASGLGGSVSLTNTYIGVGSASNTVTGSTNLTWNGTSLYSSGFGNFASGVQVGASAGLSFGASKWMIQSETSSLIRSYSCGPDTSTYSSWEHYTARSNGTPVSLMRWDANGNIGIGTSSPAAKLDIKLAADGDFLVGRYSAGTAKLVYAYQSGSDGYLELRTGADAIVTKLSGYTGTAGYTLANFGVGLTSPTTRLHVREAGATITGGNAINGTSMKGIMVDNSNNDDTSVGIWFSTGPGSHWSGISGQRTASASTWGTHLSFYTHEDATADLTYTRERMRISSAGNVGIGQTSPTYKLDVSGTGRFTNTLTVGIPNGTGSGDNNVATLFSQDYSGWATMFAGSSASLNGWGIFWAGNSSAAYGTNGAGGPGNIFSNSSNPNELVFVGNGRTDWSLQLYDGRVWQRGAFYCAGDVYSSYSDLRLKTVLGKIERAVDKVQAIETFYYEANETALELGASKGRKIGVSAQSVKEVVPEVVNTSPLSEEYMTVQYERLVPLLIEATKEQQKMIELLQKELADLKSKLGVE
jgi:hypothetical protein